MIKRVSCLLFFRWKESRGCLYERGCFILDLLPSRSFLRLSASSALTMGIQTIVRPLHKEQREENYPLPVPSSLLMQMNTAPSHILISHSTAVPRLAAPSLVQLRDKWPKKKNKITFRNPLLAEGILLSIFFVTMYFCFFMKTEESYRPGTVYKLIIFLSWHWLLGSFEPNLYHLALKTAGL